MKRTVLDFGLVGLLGVALVAGCSSGGGSVSSSGGSQGNNGSGGNSSSGGSNGSGGSSNGSGGNSSSGGSNGSGGSSNGSGGSSNGTGGSSNGSGGDSGSGSGGSSGASACAAASADLITDFGSGTAQVGKAYAGADKGLTSPTTDTSSGALVVTLDTGAGTSDTSAYPYAYVGLPFNACVDASAYTAVKFNISGTISDGCTLQFSTVDKEHNTTDNSGTCDPSTASGGSCYASFKAVTVSSDATDVTVNFADQMGGGADPGATFVDPKEILGVQWQFNVPVGMTCTSMLTIDNVTFVK